ncbi:hypothetical protein ASU31_00275 [Pedobacter ginsenosidimutans]|uniref:Uncharacterized protein n=1 Tax=Pedobacter ginsenosidimutans TaxID=687842 RepID=A0A0T5VVV2_9SPHI|nr:hypothetical protein [Pedobacter ginsenosidimutans]KRT17769.1 hypothetical protein ASU31_00275 [Pedobacter ginsenosidimutans]
MLKKINIGLVALVLGFGLTFLNSAFKSADKNARFTRQWNFIGTTLSEDLDGTKYSQSVSPPTACDSGSDLPCYLNTPDNIDTQAKLTVYIHDTYGTSEENVRDMAPKQRAD